MLFHNCSLSISRRRTGLSRAESENHSTTDTLKEQVNSGKCSAEKEETEFTYVADYEL